MENPVERALSEHTFLSIRQLQKKLNLPKRTVMYHIFNSKVIKNRSPVLHGSFKRKIKVYEINKNVENVINAEKIEKVVTFDEPEYEFV